MVLRPFKTDLNAKVTYNCLYLKSTLLKCALEPLKTFEILNFVYYKGKNESLQAQTFSKIKPYFKEYDPGSTFTITEKITQLTHRQVGYEIHFKDYHALS